MAIVISYADKQKKKNTAASSAGAASPQPANGTNQNTAAQKNATTQKNTAVNDGTRPSYADSYAKNDAADKSGVDHYHAQTKVDMSQTDYQQLVAAGEEYNKYAAQKEQALAAAATDEEKAAINAQYKGYMDAAHQKAEDIRSKYGYSGGEDGSEYLPKVYAGSGGEVSRPSTGGGTVTKPDAPTVPTVPEAPKMPETPDFQSMLDQWLTAAQTQQEAKIDYATQQGVTELQRAEEDAKAQFQTQRDQVAIDEANALDNQALYAERRGDKGGIGAVQYAAVQNAAMENRRAVNDAQTKLATDTARQIADLRY